MAGSNREFEKIKAQVLAQQKSESNVPILNNTSESKTDSQENSNVDKIDKELESIDNELRKQTETTNVSKESEEPDMAKQSGSDESMSDQTDDVDTDDKKEEEPVPSEETNDYDSSDDSRKNVPKIDNENIPKKTSDARNKSNIRIENDDKLKQKIKRVDESDMKYSQIKKFPSDLLSCIKPFFPKANTMSEVVAAYVYVKEGKPADVQLTARLHEVVNSYTGEAVTDKLDDNQKLLQNILASVYELSHVMDVVKLGIVYDIFDRIGFRKGDQSTPGNIDFLENGMSELMKTLEKQSDIKRQKDKQREGRPIR